GNSEQGVPGWLEPHNEPGPSQISPYNEDLAVEIELPEAGENESPAEEIWSTTILEPGPVNDFVEHAGDELPQFETVVASDVEPEFGVLGEPVVEASTRPESDWAAGTIETETNQRSAIKPETGYIAEYAPEAVISERPVAVLDNENTKK